MRACVCVSRREKSLQKEYGGIDLPRVRELAEFRWTRPDAALRPRRGRRRNVDARADARVARNVGGNAERLLLRIMSVHIVRQRLRNYESNLEEILFLYHRILCFKRPSLQLCLAKHFSLSSKAMEIFVVLLTGRCSAYRLSRACGRQAVRSYHWLTNARLRYFSDGRRKPTLVLLPVGSAHPQSLRVD